jgi:hypothetical protein
MPSYIPQKLDKCWSYHDVKTDRVVRACKFQTDAGDDIPAAKIVVKAPVGNEGRSLFSMPVARCDPREDKTGACSMQIGKDFFRQCDPKRDKKCTLSLDDLMFNR